MPTKKPIKYAARLLLVMGFNLLLVLVMAITHNSFSVIAALVWLAIALIWVLRTPTKKS